MVELCKLELVSIVIGWVWTKVLLSIVDGSDSNIVERRKAERADECLGWSMLSAISYVHIYIHTYMLQEGRGG